MFHHCDVLIVETGLYITHTLGIYANLALKKVFRQLEIFPEVAVYTDACAYIDGKLLIYLCLTSAEYQKHQSNQYIHGIRFNLK